MNTAGARVALPLPPARTPLAWAAYVSVPSLLWTALWFGINSGPWVFADAPAGAMGWVHWLRTAGPFAALAAGAGGLLGWRALRGTAAHPLPVSLRLWAGYGLLGLAACLLSPEPAHAAYWAVCYLAPFAVLKLALGPAGDAHVLERARRLNRLGWGIAFAMLAVLVVAARGALFVETSDGLSGYGVVNRVGRVGVMPMTRASGLSRFAAVPCLLGFVVVLRGRGTARVLGAGLALACAAVVYLMQSRGTTLALGAALSFVLVLQGGRVRLIGAVLLLGFGIAVAGGLFGDSAVERVTNHLLRTDDRANLVSLGGRVGTWERSWPALAGSPLVGRGPQADRYLTGEHAHNTYVYAALQSGLLGLALFVAGLGAAWWNLARALRSRAAELVGDRATLLQAAAVLAFFTVRSIPEVSGAMYGVDLMLLVPAMAYLGLFANSRVTCRTPERAP